jgi:hypothetical protein
MRMRWVEIELEKPRNNARVAETAGDDSRYFVPTLGDSRIRLAMPKIHTPPDSNFVGSRRVCR